jgi:two-component system, OmpR family, sensor histidine kinase KdpD
MNHRAERPDPDSLLHALKKEEEQATRGKLKIFFGMSAGVGKTYEMLTAAHRARTRGLDVVIGIVETHGRPETGALLAGLPALPRKVLTYKGTTLDEMDLDAIVARRPQLVLVDELAHSNVPGSRHTKRFQDVLEILDRGIDVYSTLNVQHLESRAGAVAQITGSIVRETVPDSVLDLADEVELIDIPPDDILKRLAEGKVYAPERSQQAIQNFFQKGNLTALREMSLRVTAERVDHQLREYMQSKRIAGPWKSGQRLLLGVSCSPHSVPLIRWARRMSYAMDASWIAVHVETSRSLSGREREQLAANIKLAGELGAEILTTADEDVAEALVRVAREQNATQLIVGKPRRGYSVRKTLLDRVMAESGDLDVYVVGGDDMRSASSTLRFPRLHSRPAHYAAAAAIVCGVAALSYPVHWTIGYQTVSLILLLTVALLSLKLGAGPVLLGAAISALVWNYFFIPPQFTFAIKSGQDILMFFSYFAIAAIAGTLTARIRAREMAVRMREERATALYSLTRDLSNAQNQDDVARTAASNIHKYFTADVALFLSDADGEVFTSAHPASTFPLDEKEFGVAAWVYWNEKKAGKFTDTLPFATATYYPMSGPRYPLGVIGVRLADKERLTLEQERLLENFIRQIASSLEREQLNEMAKKSIASVEAERLYKTLFNSISHELRTPIAAIVSASEGLLDQTTSSREEIRRDLAGEVHTAAERLDRLVENLLDMTRLESGRIAPRRDWCDMRDLISASLRKLERELAGHRVTVSVPDDFPLVKLDFGLVEQAITNLLHNASLYTPAGTEVRIGVTQKDRNCIITIEDRGPGFTREALARLFEKFYRVPGTHAGGTGLGLSIVRGYVEASGGTVTAGNAPEGGAIFTITLPAIEPQEKGDRIDS